MKKEEELEFQIEYLEKNKYDDLDEEERESLLELRKLNRRKKQHQSWIKKNQNIYDDFKRREKLIKEIVIEEKDFFNDVFSLKKVVIPKISVYFRKEKSKSLKNEIRHYKRKTYGGVPLKERIVWYYTVRMRTVRSSQKNGTLRSTESVEELVNLYFGFQNRNQNILKNKMNELLMDYFTPLLQNGWSNFSSVTYPYPTIKEWVLTNKLG